MSWRDVTYEIRMRGKYDSPVHPRQDSKIMKRFKKLYKLVRNNFLILAVAAKLMW